MAKRHYHVRETVRGETQDLLTCTQLDSARQHAALEAWKHKRKAEVVEGNAQMVRSTGGLAYTCYGYPTVTRIRIDPCVEDHEA